VDNVGHWNQKLSLLAPVTSIEVETTRFDTQKMANPKIKGVEYQQGTLAGYEVREYLLEKWQRTCAYCDKQDTALEIEHIVPKIKHGSNRVSNLTLACHACNQKKGSQDISDFVKDKKRLAKIIKQAKIPLRDAAALSSIRFAIGTRLKELGMPISFWTGGRTKFNRCAQGYTKDHWLDAACVGEGGRRVYIPKSHSVLLIQAQGRGSRQM
jgi:hypothetical protein